MLTVSSEFTKLFFMSACENTSYSDRVLKLQPQKVDIEQHVSNFHSTSKRFSLFNDCEIVHSISPPVSVASFFLLKKIVKIDNVIPIQSVTIELLDNVAFSRSYLVSFNVPPKRH